MNLMRNMFENIGFTDVKNESNGEKSKRETLHDIRENMGEEKYRSIIGKFSRNETLDKEEQELVNKNKKL